MKKSIDKFVYHDIDPKKKDVVICPKCGFEDKPWKEGKRIV